jgi:hypothetical protein
MHTSSNRTPRRLPDSWVQKIFATMQGNYGSRFINMWKTGQILANGNDAGIDNAMNHWAEKLGGYKDNPETLRKVLDNLPPEPPTLPQFLQMLRQAWVEPQTKQIERQWTEAELAANKKRIRDLIQSLNTPKKP